MELKAGDVIDGRYTVTGWIQSDTQAKTVSARDNLLGRIVSIKIIDENSISYFYGSYQSIEREVNITSSLEHPNILPIYDFGKNDDFYYIVSRHFTQTLYPRLKKNDDNFYMKTSEIIELVRPIANGIDYVHKKGLIHRNIKPATIVIDAQIEQQIYPYLYDFGFTAIEDRNVGIGYWMAPEQVNGLATFATDLYAFGLLIYQCFLYVTPFNNYSFKNIVKMKLNPDDWLYSVRRLRPELPIGIDIVLNRLCAKNPEDRYPTASAAVDDLYRVFYSGQGNIEGKVFISYATKDKDYVHQLAAELRSVGVDIWIDQDIQQGSDWGDSIENALKACDLMLLIATEASMDSAYVNHEWSYFMGLGKPVYPFVPDTKLPENIHPRLNRLQLVQGTGDMLADIQNVVTVLAGGNPKKLGGLDE